MLVSADLSPILMWSSCSRTSRPSRSGWMATIPSSPDCRRKSSSPIAALKCFQLVEALLKRSLRSIVALPSRCETNPSMGEEARRLHGSRATRVWRLNSNNAMGGIAFGRCYLNPNNRASAYSAASRMCILLALLSKNTKKQTLVPVSSLASEWSYICSV